AVKDYHMYLKGIKTDNMAELDYYQKKRIHNLKYYTWIEQQAKELEELDAQWYDWPNYWSEIHSQVERMDELIAEFNDRTGLLEELEGEYRVPQDPA
ncbi:hypothetical protein KGY64_06460, partial [Candidatus Bipolaricaulota bacterium]|nr:hypothetical protein [Candidatus Bipolaricaulota bacterium]